MTFDKLIILFGGINQIFSAIVLGIAIHKYFDIIEKSYKDKENKKNE